MKLKKLIESISELSTAGQTAQLEQRRQLKATLKKLRKKCRELEQNLHDELNPDHRKELEEKLKIISTQRAKGLGLLKELKDSSS